MIIVWLQCYPQRYSVGRKEPSLSVAWDVEMTCCSTLDVLCPLFIFSPFEIIGDGCVKQKNTQCDK